MSQTPPMSSADYQRDWRAKQAAAAGREPGKVGRPATQPHGTPAGFKRHKRAGEDPCEPCRLAERQRQADLYRKRKG